MQYVYLINCQQFYKIGIANDVQSRLAQLATGNPFDLEVLAIFGFANASPVETALHQRFANTRKHGEWFSLSENDIQDFLKICRLLGGDENRLPTLASDQEIEEAEEVQESTFDGDKWDFESMFADGWTMDIGHDGKESENGARKYNYWSWRKRKANEKGYIYGGRIADLPYPVDEIRRRFGNNK